MQGLAYSQHRNSSNHFHKTKKCKENKRIRKLESTDIRQQKNESTMKAKMKAQRNNLTIKQRRSKSLQKWHRGVELRQSEKCDCSTKDKSEGKFVLEITAKRRTVDTVVEEKRGWVDFVYGACPTCLLPATPELPDAGIVACYVLHALPRG